MLPLTNVADTRSQQNMPPPLPPGELGHSLGPRDARVTLGGHLDYVVCVAWYCVKRGVGQSLLSVDCISRNILLRTVSLLQENLQSNQKTGCSPLQRTKLPICLSSSSATVSFWKSRCVLLHVWEHLMLIHTLAVRLQQQVSVGDYHKFHYH